MTTVLVVDDVSANRELVTMLLGYRGYDVVEANDGIDALTIAQNQHPNVVISDVLMPGIDGLELVHRLRSDSDPDTARIPVIFYTANYLEPEARPIADACGVSRIVLRDADPRDLLAAVEEVLAAGPVETNVGPAAEFADTHVRTVNAKLLDKVRALQLSERTFEAMATASPVGMALLDATGNATYVNPRLAGVVGRPAEQLTGAGWLACLEPEIQREVLEITHRPSAAVVEHCYRTHLVRPDGSDRWLRVHLRRFEDAESDLVGAVVLVDDITDVVQAELRLADEARRREEEARRRDAERLDSLRRMAGGIAHDFNNLLGTMLGIAQLSIESIAEERRAGNLPAATAAGLLDDLGQITKGGERATRLTEQLLAFGRHESSEPVPVDLNGFVRAFAHGIDDQGIAVDLRLSDDIPLVCVDRRGLDRLLKILVCNACEAMPGGGTVTFRTSADVRGVLVTIDDTGAGMSADTRRRAFEPFFTTKTGCQTAGLGLATAQGIVGQAGGEISLSMPPGGGGTSVSVFFPAMTQPEEENPLPATSNVYRIRGLAARPGW